MNAEQVLGWDMHDRIVVAVPVKIRQGYFRDVVARSGPVGRMKTCEAVPFHGPERTVVNRAVGSVTEQDGVVS